MNIFRLALIISLVVILHEFIRVNFYSESPSIGVQNFSFIILSMYFIGDFMKTFFVERILNGK